MKVSLLNLFYLFVDFSKSGWAKISLDLSLTGVRHLREVSDESGAVILAQQGDEVVDQVNNEKLHVGLFALRALQKFDSLGCQLERRWVEGADLR